MAFAAMFAFLPSAWAVDRPAGMQRTGQFPWETSGASSSSYDSNSVMTVLPASENKNYIVKAVTESDKALWGMCSDKGSQGIKTGTMPDRLLYNTDIFFDGWFDKPATLGAIAPDRSEKVQEGGVEISGADNSGGESTCKGILNGSRWCDNRDGTVTDMSSGLVWLQNANCWGLMTWMTAITKPITDLRDGICGLNDDSAWGDWHLPTLDELYTLTYGPEAVTNESPYAFSGVQSDFYWSATSHAYHSTYSWYVYFNDGSVNYYSKIDHNYVWPVRNGP